jgi:hypothetical protein
MMKPTYLKKLFHDIRLLLFLTNSIELGPFWEAASRSATQDLEPKGPLPCSQEPSTGHYSELDESSPYHPILSL